MVELEDGTVNPQKIFDRVNKLAVFARSVLHLPFPVLEGVNPSFGVMSKYCELAVEVLESNVNKNDEHCNKAGDIAKILQEIADAILDRDDDIIIDCMSHLDQIIEDTRISK